NLEEIRDVSADIESWGYKLCFGSVGIGVHDSEANR
ncbi:uncharacterized protein METZ01_LOCUS251933, partial [marine metagenome]